MSSTSRDSRDLDRLCIDTIRTLSMDAVEAARSGHPGMPMAMAPVAFALWQRHLTYDPADPLWPARDRFVLSAGHASMLLYALLHLSSVRRADRSTGRATDGLAVSLDDIRRFRQLDGVCAGHPEYGLTTGVECTTGPLGQGVGVSVGMAIAARWLAARYDRPGLPLFGFRIFSLASDGDLMEGISAEAASLAGHLRLSNLCWIYDQNRITIEGSTRLTLSEDVAARFRAYGWRVSEVPDANDLSALDAAFHRFRRETGGPTLIIVNSRIAWGAPTKEGTSAAHGEPLGADEVRGAKRAYGWPEEARFHVPEEAYQHVRGGLGTRGAAARADWLRGWERYRVEHAEAAAELDLLWRGALPEGWGAEMPEFPADDRGVATRVASGLALNALARKVPWVVGGSADLGPSTKTLLAGEGDLSAVGPAGRNVRFGVREHVMGATVNGLALCGLRPYASSFLVFSDYARPALRMSALMRLPVVHVYSHDSIGLGEDGPTHQPVEHLASLRAMPGLLVLRPADGNETVEAWRVVAGLRDEPAVLVLTRQTVPTLDRARCASAAGVARGGYVLSEAPGGSPQVLLIGTGSEVALCLEAQARLASDGIRARVVSLPCWELFERQEATYREDVLPTEIRARVAVEAASPFGWERYLGPEGTVLAMKGFGSSAPGPELFRRYGFTVEAIVEAARDQVRRSGASSSPSASSEANPGWPGVAGTGGRLPWKGTT